MSSKKFENPLISNIRMRAIYRALVETRALGASLGQKKRLPRNLEACWVGTAIDLKPGDLTVGMTGDTLLQYIRSVGSRDAVRAASISDLRRLMVADPSAFSGTAADRLLCAVGAAMALKSSAGRMVMAHASAGDLDREDWRRLARAGARAALPLVLVVTPSKGAERAGASGIPVSGIPASHIPVIPVDASDAVALYRVAQECMLRARNEGGMVAIECIATGADPIKMLARQLLAKGIASEAWLAGAEERFHRMVARLR